METKIKFKIDSVEKTEEVKKLAKLFRKGNYVTAKGNYLENIKLMFITEFKGKEVDIERKSIIKITKEIGKQNKKLKDKNAKRLIELRCDVLNKTHKIATKIQKQLAKEFEPLVGKKVYIKSGNESADFKKVLAKLPGISVNKKLVHKSVLTCEVEKIWIRTNQHWIYYDLNFEYTLPFFSDRKEKFVVPINIALLDKTGQILEEISEVKKWEEVDAEQQMQAMTEAKELEEKLSAVKSSIVLNQYF